jgi:hypothetical protein
LLLCTGALAVVPGCADSEPFPDSEEPGVTEGPAPVAIPGLGHVVGEYMLQVRPSQRTAKLVRLKPGASSQPGFKPQSVDAISIEQDNTPNTGTANNVELNTTSVQYGTACPSGKAAAFCGTVTLGSFYTRSLNNVFAQVTSITDATTGATLTGHSGINSDVAPTGWSSPVDASLGLWKYTGAGMTAGAMGTTATSKFGTRIWEFADPDGADTNIYLRVIASLTYSNYARTASTATWIDACAEPTHTSLATGTGALSSTMSFPFTFYDQLPSTKINYNRDGMFTIGALATSPPTDSSNTNYPTTPVTTTLPEIPQVKSVSPGAYVFWDGLNYGTATGTIGAICTATDHLTAAPQRHFVITWKNMKIFGAGGNNLYFSAILTEGSDTIDMLYNVITGSAATTAVTTTAVIGAVQGPANGTTIASPFGAGPGTTSTATSGTKFRFSPIP